MTIRLLFLLALTSLGISCNKAAKELSVSAEDLSNIQVTPEDLVFTLKKGGCFGTCPIYSFRIYDNRLAEFVGKNHTDKMGTYRKMISKNTLSELKQAFDDASFMDLQDFYESNIADLPTIKITYKKGKEQKTVAGKRERPEDVHKLQFRLEQIAESMNDWVKISDETGGMIEVKEDKSQIVIDIAKGNEMPRWFDDMREKFGLQILQRLSDNNDSWLVTYDSKDHNAEEVLKYFQASPVVRSAKFRQIKK